MPRPLPRLLPLVCAATLAATLGGGLLCASRALAQPAASAPGLKAGGALPAAAQPSSAVIEARTRAAAERILVALRNGDADTRYRQFAPSLQRMTSPTMIRQRINAMPKVLRWTLGAVVPGQDSSTITAHLITSAGPRALEMVIDADGLLEGYHFDAADQPAETVARQFEIGRAHV